LNYQTDKAWTVKEQKRGGFRPPCIGCT